MAIFRHHHILRHLRKTVVSLPPVPPVRMFSKLHFDPSSTDTAARTIWGYIKKGLFYGVSMWPPLAYLDEPRQDLVQKKFERTKAIRKRQHLANVMELNREMLRLLQNEYGEHGEGIMDPEIKAIFRRLHGDRNMGSSKA